jgi:membrane-associated protease RseP (regulator of RpoE activity)
MLGFAHFALVLGQQAHSLPAPSPLVALVPLAPSAVQQPAPPPAPAQGYLGITVTAAEGGVRIDSVTGGSPAEACGLETGDLILSLAGRGVRSPSEVVEAVSSRSAGSDLAIEILRGERRMTLLARLAPRGGRAGGGLAVPAAPRPPQSADLPPRGSSESTRELARENQQRARAAQRDAERQLEIALEGLEGQIEGLRFGGPGGMEFRPRPMLGVVLGDHGEGGALIESVVEGSGAEGAGLTDGDRVIGVDGAPVLTAEDLRAAIRGAEVGDRLRLEVQRGEEQIEVEAELGAGEAAAMALAPGFKAPDFFEAPEDPMSTEAEGRWLGSDPASAPEEEAFEDWVEEFSAEMADQAERWAESWEQEMERFSSEFEQSMERWQDEFDAWVDEFQGQLEARLEGRAESRSRPAPRPPRIELRGLRGLRPDSRPPQMTLPRRLEPGQALRHEWRLDGQGQPEVKIWRGRLGDNGEFQWEVDTAPEGPAIAPGGGAQLRFGTRGGPPEDARGLLENSERAALQAEIRALRAELEAVRAGRLPAGGR